MYKIGKLVAMVKRVKRFGDRKDARLIREVDGVHVVLANVMGERCENEAVLTMDIDSRPLDAYLKLKNASGDKKDKYTYLQLFIAALSKTIELRPKLNYFVCNSRYYEKDEISFVFVAKRYLEDSSDEILIFSKYDPEDERSPLQQIHDRYVEKVYPLKADRDGKQVGDPLEVFARMPKPIVKLVGKIVRALDRHGHLPWSIQNMDPSHVTCFISNLGSIDMVADYHHLTNWGTTSIFALMGRKTRKPVYDDDGSFELIPFIPLSFTVDERIADGVYFHKSLMILRDLLEHPEKLEEGNSK